MHVPFRRPLRPILCAVAARALAGPLAAQGVPRSYAASPEVYRVLAQNATQQVIAVTWQPGQRDVPHGHPAAAMYALTDCRLRMYGPDGSALRDVSFQAGYAAVQEPIAAHAVENIGAAECRLIMFEPR